MSKSSARQLADKPTHSARWCDPEGSHRFAVFRVVLGIVLLAIIIHLYSHLKVFPNIQAWLLPIGPVLLLWSAILVCLIIGYHTRAASVANFLCCAVMLGILAPNGGFQQAAGDSVAISLSLLAVILPCGEFLAVDRIGAARTAVITVAGARWLLAAYLRSVYIDSGIHKLFSPMWSSGFGVTTPMGLPSLVWMDTGWLAWFPPVILRLLGWAVIGFELSFPFLYAWRPTRIACLVSGIALHIGIAVIYPIPAFSGLMIAAYAGLLPAHWYSAFLKVKFPNNLTSAVSSPAWLGSLTLRRAIMMIAVWGLFIVLTYAPKFTTYRPLELPLKAARKMIYVATGISSHAVFEDNGFVRYRYQLRLVPAGVPRAQVPAPYSRPDGLLSWSVRGRVWEQWWKRTQAPPVPLHEAESHLGTWAEFYWHPSGHPITVRIEARPQEVDMHGINTRLFSKNNAVAWRSIGSIRLVEGANPQTAWRNPPRDKEKCLGDYVSRVLAEYPR